MIRLRRTELENGRGVPVLVPGNKYLMVKVGNGFLKETRKDNDAVHYNPITRKASLACVFYPKKKNDGWPGYKYTREDAEKMAAYYGGKLVWVTFVLEPFVPSEDKGKTDISVLLRVGESLFSTGRTGSIRGLGPFTDDFRNAAYYQKKSPVELVPPLYSLKNALKDQEKYGGQLFKIFTEVSDFPY